MLRSTWTVDDVTVAYPHHLLFLEFLLCMTITDVADVVNVRTWLFSPSVLLQIHPSSGSAVITVAPWWGLSYPPLFRNLCRFCLKLDYRRPHSIVSLPFCPIALLLPSSPPWAALRALPSRSWKIPIKLEISQHTLCTSLDCPSCLLFCSLSLRCRCCRRRRCNDCHCDSRAGSYSPGPKGVLRQLVLNQGFCRLRWNQ
mgnify:CR=1 FL=1